MIKNYNELCDLLHMDNTRGNTKKANLKNIQRFCSYDQIGQKFIIKEIYDLPKEKKDGRSAGNNSVYISLFETLLLSIFLKSNSRTLYFTKTQLWELLFMINSKFKKNYGNTEFLQELKKQDDRAKQWHIDRAYNNTRNKMNSITRSALKSLSNRKLITYRDDEIVACKDGKYIVITDDSVIEKIMQCEKEALNILKCKSIQDVLFSRRKGVTWKTYTDLRNAKLKASLGYKYIFRHYVITCNRSYLTQGIDENISELRKTLNNNIIESLVKQAEKEYATNKADFESGNTTFCFAEGYTEIQSLIFEEILRIDEKDETMIEKYITFLDQSNTDKFSYDQQYKIA